MSEARYYTWKKKYADLGVTELRRLKMLEDENSRLKRIVADLTLDKQILQEEARKSSEGCQAMRAGSLDARALPSECATVVPSGHACVDRSGTPRARHAVKARYGFGYERPP